MTAVAILRVVDQGLLSLDDRPQIFIGGWEIDPSDSLYAMTLSDLLSFTSGLIDNPTCIDTSTADFETCIKKIAIVNAGNGKIPGEEFFYGPSHMQVAGLMAVKAGDLDTWQDLFLHFKNETGLFPDGTYDIPSIENPRLAGGMHWKGSEYADFIKAFQFGDLLREETRNRMMTDRIAAADISRSPARENLDEEWHYGYGLWLECHHPPFDCDPISYYSSPGAYGAYPFINTRYRFFGVLARQGKSNTLSEGKAVYDAVADLAEQWAKSESCENNDNHD